MQKDVAASLGVHVETLKNWETGIASPTVRQIPKILTFLGYNPEPEPRSLPEHIVHARRRLGLTQKEFAKVLGADSVTLYRWEKGLTIPGEVFARRLQKLAGTARKSTPQ